MRPRVPNAFIAPLLVILGLGCSSPRAEVTSCSVGGESIHDGTLNPENQCQVCRATANAGGWSNIPAGAPCGLDGGSFCTGGSCQSGCYIDAIFYAPGAPNPSNGCTGCQPSINPIGWSPVTGTPPTGTCPQNGVCYQGHCQPGCTIGTAQYPGGAPNPDNSCESCQPGQSTLTWTDRPPGATCADGGAVCASGNCTAGCEIGGVFYGPGGVSPDNDCQTCQPKFSLSSFSPATGLAAGGDCGNGAYCYQGQCSGGCSIAGTSYAPGDPDPQSTCLGCVPAVSAITWSNLDPGTPCAGGGVCGGGVCLFGCDIGGVLFPPDTGNPSNVCQSCQPAASANGWSPLTGIPVDPCSGGNLCLDGGCATGCFIKRTYYGPGVRKPGNVAQCCSPSADPTGWSAAFVQGLTFVGPPLNNGSAYYYYYGYYNTASQIVASDFNHDGLIDVAVLAPGGGVGIYLNIGDAGFGLPTSYTPTGLATSLAIGDLNGDGYQDLVVATADGGVSVFPSIGGAGFGGETTYTSNAEYLDAGPDAGLYYYYDYYYYPGTGGQTATVADINGDGVLDVIVTGGVLSSTVSVLLGIGDGGLRPGVAFDAGFFSSYQVLAADLNGDGAPDLIVMGDRQLYSNYPYYYYYIYSFDPGISVLLNDGNGGFAEPAPVTGTSATFQLADFNRDGLIDLALLDNSTPDLSLLTGIGNGGFNTATRYPTSYGYQVVVGDFDGDGTPDIFELDSYSSGLFLNKGDGTFNSSGTLAGPSGSTSASAAVAADFNGDGRDDLAVVNYGGTWTIWINVCH